jgi:hypothetical protein
VTALCTHGVQTGAGYECAACVTTPALDCGCTDDLADAACRDHGLAAFLRAAFAAEAAREANTEGATA